MEASGPYSALLGAQILRRQRSDMILHRLAPAQVRDFAKTRSRRRTKTDRLDARTLALFLLLRQQWTTHALPISLFPDTFTAQSLASLARLCERLTQESTRIQNHVRQLLHFLFPELERRQARFSKALRILLARFPSAPAIAQASLEGLQQALPKGHRMSLHHLQELQRLARYSLGLHDPLRAQALQLLLARWAELEAWQTQVFHALQQAVQQQFPQAWRLLLAIPGIGPKVAAYFLALVGPLHHFPNANALVAYAGLDITLYQSGKYQGRRCLSKRGAPLLHHVLYLMAVALKRRTHRFARAYAYYRQQGRAARETLVILARKALVMLFHLLTH